MIQQVCGVARRSPFFKLLGDAAAAAACFAIPCFRGTEVLTQVFVQVKILAWSYTMDCVDSFIGVQIH